MVDGTVLVIDCSSLTMDASVTSLLWIILIDVSITVFHGQPFPTPLTASPNLLGGSEVFNGVDYHDEYLRSFLP